MELQIVNSLPNIWSRRVDAMIHKKEANVPLISRFAGNVSGVYRGADQIVYLYVSSHSEFSGQWKKTIQNYGNTTRR